MNLNTGPDMTYTVVVRGQAHPFDSRDGAATYTAARILEGETDISYIVPGASEAVRQQRESGLIAKIEELLAKHGRTL